MGEIIIKKRKLRYSIDWKNAWEKMRSERKRKAIVTYEPDFFKKSLHDFSKVAKFNDYEYGKKAFQILDNVLNEKDEILEIVPGPGNVTVLWWER